MNLKFLLTLIVVLSCCFYSRDAHAGASGADQSPERASIYDAKMGLWSDDSSAKVNLNQFKGKKVVLAMVYTTCQMSCPLIVKKLKKLDEALKEKKITAEFVIVSFDSKFDTSEKLALFRKRHAIGEPRWHLLVGSEKDTRFLSNLLEIRFSRNPKDLTISHDNKIILLNEAGEIVRTLEGLSLEADEKLY